MPRQARIDAPGALHHIMIRGMEGNNIFRDNKDRDDFISRLESILIDTSTPCYAWTLMSNHIHLLIRTGSVPISHVMRKLLTGYAVKFNLRHNRHGKLFQSRYKSILCQEDPYLLELVRYIHLNPLRAGLVKDLSQLNKFRYSGHSFLLGNRKNDWQNIDYVLRFFAKREKTARKRYLDHVEKGMQIKKRPDLVGGGLIKFERRYELKSRGIDISALSNKAAEIFGVETGDIFSPGKYPKRVKARSVLCYWAVRELGETASNLAKKIGISQPAVSQAVERGERIVKELKLEI
jgi:putative transposase